MVDLQKLALAKCPILIIGPTGAGKSHLAENIHRTHRPGKPFVEVDMAALHETIFDSQLFGHRRGSFTGAVGDQPGLCKTAKDGTLFLDEIGDLGLGLQKKLLMLIEKRSFLPIGSNVRLPFQGSFIFATNRDIGRLVEQGKFRQDLYYRIRVVEVAIEPLCGRRAELPGIMSKLIFQLQEKYGKKALHLSDELQEFMLGHSWPGNIRELKNVLEYLFVFAEGEVQMSDIPAWLIEGDRERARKSFHQAMEDFEQRYFTRVLEQNHGRINQTSREIGISKSTLIMKAKKYNIDTSLLRARIGAYNAV